jgi:hypothetical protein
MPRSFVALAAGEFRIGNRVAPEQNVARTHSSLSASSTAGVVEGQGPSSNVNTISFRRQRQGVWKLFAANPALSAVSTASTRSVPSASGLPGHESARAAVDAPRISSMRNIECPITQRFSGVGGGRDRPSAFRCTMSAAPAFAARKSCSDFWPQVGRKWALSALFCGASPCSAAK